MKKFLLITILFFSIPSIAHGATEFVSIVDPGASAESDYSSLSTWETGLGTNLTAPSTLVFSGTVTGTAPADNASVTLIRAGSAPGVTATVVHTEKAGTKILLENVSNPAYGFTSGDQWQVDGSNYFAIDATAPDQPQVTAKCRTTNGAADTAALTISGWDTSATNYIKIYTDPSENYRHKGVWDEGKYRLTSLIVISEENTRIDGLQIYVGSSSSNINTIIISTMTNANVQISNNIIRASATGSANGWRAILHQTGATTSNSYIWNNIIYNFINGSNNDLIAIRVEIGWTSYIYNNTVSNCYTGIVRNGGTAVAKNNVANNNTNADYSGTFDTSSTYNITNKTPSSNIVFGTAADSGTTSSTTANKLVEAGQNFLTTVKIGMVIKNTTDTTYTYVTAVDSDTQLSVANDIMPTGKAYTIYTNMYGAPTFVDAYNNDFHLDSSDTVAKNKGTNLYADASLAVTTDIDGNARQNSATTFDIGADENVAAIYRSVGAGATAALVSGGNGSNYGYMEIKPAYLNVGSTANLTDHIATFWRALPDNIGVGDAISYDADNTGGIDNTVFITKRIDSTHYSVRKADGTAPTPTTLNYNTGWNIRRAYTSLGLAEEGTENVGIGRTFDAGNVNLTTDNLQWNFTMYANGTAPDTTAVTVDGWTTVADNYIKIYTPTRTDEVGTSQRHLGVWNTSKYYMSVIDATAIDIRDDYVSLDGLQVGGSGYTAIDKPTIYITAQTDGANKINISNIYVNRAVTNYTGQAIYIYNNGYTSVVDIWNSIIIGSGNYNWSDVNACVANNRGMLTIYNSTLQTSATSAVGLANWGGTIVAKNVYAKASTGYAYSASITMTNAASSDATGSAGLQNIAFDTTNFTNVTVGSEDLHLGVNSALKNVGTDLSNDLTIPIKTDIDSSGSRDAINCPVDSTDACYTRPTATSFDIGADELITKIYRSVGVGTTAAIISGSNPSITLTIAGTTGTFSTFPTSAAFGVGDVIRYDSDNNGTNDSTAFITAIDSTAKTATLQSATGAAPTAMAVGDIDWKLYRAYVKLSEWESGTENTGVGVTYDAGNLDIASRSEQWNVAAYSPAGTDTTAPDGNLTINGWTTAKQNYIKVYTPTVSTEVTTSQRHQGKWDDNKYHLTISNATAIYTTINNIWIDGLQIKINSTNASDQKGIDFFGVEGDAQAVEYRASNNLVAGYASNNQALHEGIRAYHGTAGNSKSKIWNNVVYNFPNGSGSGYGFVLSSTLTDSVYNNIVVSSGIGFYGGSTAILKNNIAQSCTDGFNGTFDASSDYNISDLASDAPGSHSKNSTTVTFVDATNKDYHLASTDTAARNSGADLSKDIYFPVTTDINGHTRYQIRDTSYYSDIGADEAATAIYRSIAPSATGSIASGTNPANSLIISGTAATFGTAPGTTVGVGDAIQYDSDNNGTVDSVVFITYRTDSTHYLVQTHDGGTPTSTSATDYDWSIFRAHTTLDNAEGGVENTGISDAVEHFDQDVGVGDGKDIYTPNQQWNIAAYANSTNADTTAVTVQSWTTYPTNYIKMYTPTAATEVGTSQRHQGKLDTSKYSLSINHGGGGTTMNITIPFIRIEGLQFNGSASSGWGGNEIMFTIPNNLTSSDVRISHNIIKSDYSSLSDPFAGGSIADNGWSVNGGNKKIFDNIIYGVQSSHFDVSIVIYGGTTYIYNNTIAYPTTGVIRNGGTVILKNNIAQNCVGSNGCYHGTFDSSSDYNISDVDASDAPNATFTNDYATVTFSDEANYDFHLAANDTAARNAGADLTSDPFMPINPITPLYTDIDGHARPTGANTWDIGADEGATHIYYSVGQSTATDLKTGTPTITTVGIGATFNTAQTGNIGVGDKVTYTGGSCFISGKISTTQWNCQGITGGTAAQVSGASVTSITRAFGSLSSAISGSTAPTFLNTSDLQTNNYVLDIPCYYDTGADTTAVTVRGYTTAVPNYIKIYTPNNTTTEANNSQRHNGKWDGAKYNITNIISISRGRVVIDGLQFYIASDNGTIRTYDSDNSSEIKISNNIIKSNNSSQSVAILLAPSGSGFVAKIWNNLIYDFETTNNQTRVIYNNSSTVTSYIYNNTIVGGYAALHRSSGTMVAYNDVAQNCTDCYVGVSSGDYNISSATSDAPSASYRSGLATTVTFADSTNKDYHLAQTDTGAKNYGTNLSADSTYAFSTDIDGNQRSSSASTSAYDPRTWDIGADEAATAVYYSVGQSTSDLKTGSPTLSIDVAGAGTLSVAQTGNMGVGDYIEYGTAPYTKAYITAKTSTTVWTVQSATGSLLGVATTEPVNSIKHTWSTLNGAVAGSSGANYINSTDLQTNNYQLNIPCYYDSAADTTAVTISGYTTGPTTYIKAYTPSNTSTEANNSQRHSGKWDDGKYRLELTDDITLSSNFISLDGLQIQLSGSGTSNERLLVNPANGSVIQIYNNIIRGAFSGAANNKTGIATGYSGSGNRTLKAWNNTVYDFVNGSNNQMFGIYVTYGWTAYLYNNTTYNNYYGIYRGGGTVTDKNNISYNNTDNYTGTFDGTSTNNLSGPTQTDAPGTAPQNGVTVQFVDSGNNDFHLAASDTSARNAGADLSVETQNFASLLTYDIDGSNRNPGSAGWDIGADEVPAQIYYSVGQNTSDHMTLGAGGSAPTITVSGFTATLNVGQTATNMGVGDLITYTGGSCYISGKTSTTVWNCQSATGGTAPQVTTQAVSSIAHAFSSMNSAIGIGGSAPDSSHLNTSDLYTGNYILNIPAYYDTGADTTAVTISGYTTAAPNYIKIYTPNSTTSEVNQSQRHQGKWDESKYYMKFTNSAGISLLITDVKIDGLQLYNYNQTSGSDKVLAYGPGNVNQKISLDISNNIIKAGGNLGMNYFTGFFGSNTLATGSVKIWNNIFYDWTGSGFNNSGVWLSGFGANAYIYNNTFHNNQIGIYLSDGTTGSIAAKNNLFKSCTTAASGTFAAGSGYNSTNNSSMDYTVTDGAVGDRVSQTINFVDEANDDFHLTPGDSAARNSGADLSADAYLPFSTDIDGETRKSAVWDIGADENNNVVIEIKRGVNFGRGVNIK